MSDATTRHPDRRHRPDPPTSCGRSSPTATAWAAWMVDEADVDVAPGAERHGRRRRRRARRCASTASTTAATATAGSASRGGRDDRPDLVSTVELRRPAGARAAAACASRDVPVGARRRRRRWPGTCGCAARRAGARRATCDAPTGATGAARRAVRRPRRPDPPGRARAPRPRRPADGDRRWPPTSRRPARRSSSTCACSPTPGSSRPSATAARCATSATTERLADAVGVAARRQPRLGPPPRPPRAPALHAPAPVEPRPAPRRQPVAGPEALGQPERLELADVGLERQALHAQLVGEVAGPHAGALADQAQHALGPRARRPGVEARRAASSASATSSARQVGLLAQGEARIGAGDVERDPVQLAARLRRRASPSTLLARRVAGAPGVRRR